MSKKFGEMPPQEHKDSQKLTFDSEVSQFVDKIRGIDLKTVDTREGLSNMELYAAKLLRSLEAIEDIIKSEGSNQFKINEIKKRFQMYPPSERRSKHEPESE